jgi:6-phosphogluconate dehydrogenase (decarboxylating)
MTSAKHIIIPTAAAAFLITGTTGCQMFFHSVEEQDPASSSTLTAKYDHKDLDILTRDVSAKLLQNKVLQSEDRPIYVMMGIQNRTENHIDMQAISDTMMNRLMESGNARFVNSADRDKLLKEQGYQLANVTEATRSAIGKQLGAKYMVTGSLVEISHKSPDEVRVSRKQDVYYQMTVKVTNLETAMVEAIAQEERLRRASKPIIRW